MTEYRKELVSPNGETYFSTSPAETNNLIYGSGYREVDEPTADADKNEPAATENEVSPVDPYPYGDEVSP